MAAPDTLDRGRDAFRRQSWTDAFTLLTAADREQPLDPDDLEQLATAAYLIGSHPESADIWTRAHHELLRRGDVERAARCAFWLGFGLQHLGARARAGAWFERARRLLDDRDPQCAARGYLLLPLALQKLVEGDAAASFALFGEAEQTGDRCNDPDLAALARHARGRVLIRMGRTREGIRLLDEAMIAVETGELSPLVVGDVYCSVIEGCLEIFDLRRASEWTTALTRWCESQQDLVPYSGQCLVRRAEILQLHGAWPEAAAAARHACERLLRPPGEPASGAALYQSAELHRLAGGFAEAEAGYREASRRGRKPQPGLALLRLAQGQIEPAATAIRLAVDEARGRAARARLLPACVEILLEAGDVAGARAAAEELAAIAGDLDAPFLQAIVAHARGAVLLSEGDARGALAALREAWTMWQEIDIPYEAARTRVLIGRAYRHLGDRDAAEMEFDAARWIFEQLGARPDVVRVEAFTQGSTAGRGGLSPRELQVLRLIATGRTNRQIAADLFISERTVERHVSNIFNKLDVASRAAATAYAYEHQLV